MQASAASARRANSATAHEIKQARRPSPMGLIIREKEPHNLESPFAQVDSFLTPTELFYIRSARLIRLVREDHAIAALE